MWNNIIKPDSVQNGVRLLKLSVRFVELQSKPFLSMNWWWPRVLCNKYTFSVVVIKDYNIPITDQSMTTNINKIDGYENLIKYFIVTFNNMW